MSLALFGGSFDPAHLGHKAVVDAWLSYNPGSQVILMPCRANPLKNKDSLLPDLLRRKLLHTLFEGYGFVLIDSYELNRPAPSFTIDTVEHLRRKFAVQNTERIEILIGDDLLDELELWKDWKKLQILCRFNVFPRVNKPVPSLPHFRELNMQTVKISSSAVRENFSKPFSSSLFSDLLSPLQIRLLEGEIGAGNIAKFGKLA